MLMLLAAGGILFVVIAAALCDVLVRSIVKPMQRAVAIARTVADGDLSLTIEVKSRDEIGEFFGAMKGRAPEDCHRRWRRDLDSHPSLFDILMSRPYAVMHANHSTVG